MTVVHLRTFAVLGVVGVTATATALVVGSVAGAQGSTSVDGPPRPVGNGSAHTYVTVGPDDTPTAIGVRLDAAALEGLTSGLLPTTEAYVLDVPDGAPATVVDHVTLDWNSHGHNPEHGFDQPHFDVHFYLVDTATVESINPLVPGYLERAAKLPDPKYFPEGYAPSDPQPILGTVPNMGLHWLDTAEPHGHFTETVLQGSWDGRHVFIEPMMTRDWLASRPDLHEELRQPSAYQQSGYYPTTYSVTWDDAAGQYVVELGGLTMREAS